MSRALHDWDSFVEALLDRFGLTSYDYPMEYLTWVRQTWSVEEYKANFEALLIF